MSTHHTPIRVDHVGIAVESVPEAVSALVDSLETADIRAVNVPLGGRGGVE
ncbi:hypothetical protein SAMN04487950_4520 [Halogranum rubrum]|uniref:Uncharacterized protein n=1 Tax=Halogranum rubrum TaxID=553466 RepID=A0A1I4JH62_9EURY|nr:hypothetical protein [Halogranum rubrum]SFL65928.1 hypothetical protein SAMN04487950_4520 [Halogranum rubrum]